MCNILLWKIALVSMYPIVGNTNTNIVHIINYYSSTDELRKPGLCSFNLGSLIIVIVVWWNDWLIPQEKKNTQREREGQRITNGIDRRTHYLIRSRYCRLKGNGNKDKDRWSRNSVCEVYFYREKRWIEFQCYYRQGECHWRMERRSLRNFTDFIGICSTIFVTRLAKAHYYFIESLYDLAIVDIHWTLVFHNLICVTLS